MYSYRVVRSAYHVKKIEVRIQYPEERSQKSLRATMGSVAISYLYTLYAIRYIIYAIRKKEFCFVSKK